MILTTGNVAGRIRAARKEAGVSFDDWIAYIESLHCAVMELGLERVHKVWTLMGIQRPAKSVILIGGTNGKGSTARYCELLLLAGGRSVATYTSPHLEHFNERLRVNGRDVSDAEWAIAFESVEHYRQAAQVTLTFFEFTTLSALHIAYTQCVEIAILEVGLGGRLDATNIVEPDVSILTSIGLDHQEWLGTTRTEIGIEKAGIARAGKPIVVAEADIPDGVLDVLHRDGAISICAGIDYTITRQVGAWQLRTVQAEYQLDYPGIQGHAQVSNAAAAVVALGHLGYRGDSGTISRTLRTASLPGRIQVVLREPEVILDVSHNAHCVYELANWLRANYNADCVAVFSALRDKEIEEIVSIMGSIFAEWHIAPLPLDVLRRTDLHELRKRVLLHCDVRSVFHESLYAAMESAFNWTSVGGRIVVFGSFHTVEFAIKWIRENGPSQNESLGIREAEIGS